MAYTSSSFGEAVWAAGILQQPYVRSGRRWGQRMCHWPSKMPLNKFLIKIAVLVHNRGKGSGCWSYSSNLMENPVTLLCFPLLPAGNSSALGAHQNITSCAGAASAFASLPFVFLNRLLPSPGLGHLPHGRCNSAGSGVTSVLLFALGFSHLCGFPRRLPNIHPVL